MWSDSEAQKKRPPMLNSDSSPTKPAAIVAIATLCEASSAAKPTSGFPIKAPPKISCSMGEAIASTPIPAETFRQRINQSSQNCGVLCASSRCTLLVEIIALALVDGVQPSGCQPAGDTR